MLTQTPFLGLRILDLSNKVIVPSDMLCNVTMSDQIRSGGNRYMHIGYVVLSEVDM